MVMWLSFVQVLFLLLNNETKEFASFADSMATCFQIILGKFNMNIFATSQSSLSVPLFVAYNVIIIFIMVNLLVSILVSGFDLARKDADLSQNDPDMFNYLKELVSSVNPFQAKKTLKKKNGEKKSFVYVEFTQTLEKRVESLMIKFKQVEREEYFYLFNFLFKKRHG